jgi:ribosome maturation protein SDO1
MTQTIARIKQKGKNFEIIVELEEALKFKKGESNWLEIGGDRIFKDSKKGDVASRSDLEECFGTSDVLEVAKKIIKNGEVLLTQEFRDEERENRLKQVIDFLSRNTINPQTNKPHTPERIKTALEEAHVNIKNVPIENQIQEIIGHISSIIPIKIETKKFKLIIPAIYTGKIYNIINSYKEEENWMNDGSLEVIVKIPAGITIDFFDKLNSMTHGAIVSEEIKE